MPINVNCTSFRPGGDCLHQAAPRRWFGPARCIVWLGEMRANTDPRQVRVKCALCAPHLQPVILPPPTQRPGWPCSVAWTEVDGAPPAPSPLASPPVHP